jgi:hypothetical protein
MDSVNGCRKAFSCNGKKPFLFLMGLGGWMIGKRGWTATILISLRKICQIGNSKLDIDLPLLCQKNP